jgi:transposase
MEVTFPRCCGLDVHKKNVVACRITPGPDGQPVKSVRSFATFTDDLLQLADWLVQEGVTHVAMESTGVYWKPIYNLLEDRFTLLVVNASHIKTVPGRKTDVKDAEWIADLLRHGLLRPSFIPDRPQRQLRELTRYRTSLVEERAAQINRLQKTLEGANIKLASVATDVTGVSARQILSALVSGQTDPETLVQLAKGRLREKQEMLKRALVGQFGEHEQFLIAQQLAHLDELDQSVGAISQEILRRLGESPPPRGGEPETRESAATEEASERKSAPPVPSKEEAIARLMTIPGVGRRTAELLVAEIGTDMSRFATVRHLGAWAGMAPGNHESGGKRKSGRTRKGSPWLRRGLVEAAKAAGRTKETYLSSQYQRLKARRGARRAAVAVGHTILGIAYYLLLRGTTYQELGGNYFDERDRRAVKQRAVRRLESLGYEVTIHDKAAA